MLFIFIICFVIILGIVDRLRTIVTFLKAIAFNEDLAEWREMSVKAYCYNRNNDNNVIIVLETKKK